MLRLNDTIGSMERPSTGHARRGLLLLDLIPELVAGSLFFVGICLALAWLPAKSKRADDESNSVRSFAAPTGAALHPIYDLVTLGSDRIAWCTNDRRMWARDFTSPAPAATQSEFHDVMRIASSARSGRLFTGLVDGTIQLKNAGGALPTTIGAHRGFVAALVADAAGRHVASAGADMKVRVFDVDARKEIDSIDCGRTICKSLALSADGNTVIIGLNQSILVWDCVTHSRRTVLESAEMPADVSALAVSQDGRFVAVGRWDGQQEMWDLETRQRVWTEGESSGPCLAVEFSTDGKSLLNGQFDGKLIERDAMTGEKGFELAAHTGAVRGIRVLDKSIVLTFGYDGQIRRWNVETASEVFASR